MLQYYHVTGKLLDPLPHKPELSDYYTLLPGQQNREIAFIIFGMAATGVVAYKFVRFCRQNKIFTFSKQAFNESLDFCNRS